MQKTNISWTNFTSNPLKYRYLDGQTVWACVHASPGCQHCYAEALALRYARGKLFNVANMKEVEPFVDDKEIHKILTYKPAAGKMCFLGDMTDIFGEWVPFELIDKIFAAMALRPDVTFQILTKRAERMREYILRLSTSAAGVNRDWPKLFDEPAREIGEQLGKIRMRAICERPDVNSSWPLDNLWLGVSAESQEWADKRIPLMLDTPAAVRFVSYEPALGPVDFTNLQGLRFDSLYGVDHGKRKLDWIIIGGESRMLHETGWVSACER